MSAVPKDKVPELDLWRAWFLTSAHRWVTLFVVFGSPEFYASQKTRYWKWMIFLPALIAGVYFYTRSFALIIIADYTWNAWHFAAQHSGVQSAYLRLANIPKSRQEMVDRFLLRGFIFYVICRIGGFAITQTDRDTYLLWFDSLMKQIQFLDAVVWLIPFVLCYRHFIRKQKNLDSSFWHLLSVCILFLTTLAAVHFYQSHWVYLLSLAGACFHALEYLSLISWSWGSGFHSMKHRFFKQIEIARNRRDTLLFFCCACGLFAYFFERFEGTLWMAFIYITSYLHYVYDGMIWKARATQPV